MAKKGEAYYRYSYEELTAFCLQISLLLEAAVPLEEGLAIMAEDAAAQSEKDMLLYMAEGVELGDPFFKVMEDTGVFPAYVVRMAKLGQQTGTIWKKHASAMSSLPGLPKTFPCSFLICGGLVRQIKIGTRAV